MVLAGLVIIWQGVAQALGEVRAAQGKLQQARNERELMRQVIKKDETVFQKFNQVRQQGEVQKVKQAIPVELKLDSTLEVLRGLAQSSGLVVSGVKIMPKSSDQSTQEGDAENSDQQNKIASSAVLELTSEGSYEGLRVLTRAIETNLPLMDIQEVQVRGESEGEESSLQINMSLKTYYIE